MENIINFDPIEEKMNKELAQGFRTTYSILLKQLSVTIWTLSGIAGTQDADTLAHIIGYGGKDKEIILLCNDLETWGHSLVNMSKAIERDYKSMNPDVEFSGAENIEKDNVADVVKEYFHKSGYIVDEMLKDFNNRMSIELSNSFRDQLSGKKKDDDKKA